MGVQLWPPPIPGPVQGPGQRTRLSPPVGGPAHTHTSPCPYCAHQVQSVVWVEGRGGGVVGVGSYCSWRRVVLSALLGGWGVMEATALGEKLFLSLVVRARSVRYLSPDGRGTNKVCPG